MSALACMPKRGCDLLLAAHTEEEPLHTDSSSPETERLRKSHKRRRHSNKEPLRAEYRREEDFQVAWERWRMLRDRNNDAVKRSRQRSKAKVHGRCSSKASGSFQAGTAAGIGADVGEMQIYRNMAGLQAGIDAFHRIQPMQPLQPLQTRAMPVAERISTMDLLRSVGAELDSHYRYMDQMYNQTRQPQPVDIGYLFEDSPALPDNIEPASRMYWSADVAVPNLGFVDMRA